MIHLKKCRALATWKKAEFESDMSASLLKRISLLSSLYLMLNNTVIIQRKPFHRQYRTAKLAIYVWEKFN